MPELSRIELYLEPALDSVAALNDKKTFSV